MRATPLLVAATAAAVCALASRAPLPAAHGAAGVNATCPARMRIPVARGVPRRLRFGIFPGGSAGVASGARPRARREIQRRIDARLTVLRGRRSFVVRLYTEYSSPNRESAALASALGKTLHYARRGYLVEWVVRYRPAAATDVRGYAAFVARFVRRVGTSPRVISVQVGNEVNLPVAPDAADGSYPGARPALVAGVLAAAREAHRRRITAHVRIGMNWAELGLTANDIGFFSELRQLGGRPFARALAFVGADVYPGTFYPPPGTQPVASGMAATLRKLRECLMPRAALGHDTAIHVTENGWPTGLGRSAAAQRVALQRMIAAVTSATRSANVTDYRWFDLRDVDSSSTDFQQQFGLTRDDYTPKTAFAAYRRVIARFGR